MNRRSRSTCFAWLCLASYLWFGAVMPNGVVYCQASNGHAAIEMSGAACDEVRDGSCRDGAGCPIPQLNSASCVDASIAMHDYTPRPDDFEVSLVGMSHEIVAFIGARGDVRPSGSWRLLDERPRGGASAFMLMRTVILLV